MHPGQCFDREQRYRASVKFQFLIMQPPTRGT